MCAIFCIVKNYCFVGRKVRYAVQYSFTKNYENFWLMKATFTKHLAAFSKVERLSMYIFDIHVHIFNNFIVCF